MRFELIDFFTQQRKEKLVKFLPGDVISLAHLVDIFGRLNELNLSLQGHDITIINFIDILSACEFAKYFPDTTRDDLVFVRNLYIISDTDLVNIFNRDNSTQRN